MPLLVLASALDFVPSPFFLFLLSVTLCVVLELPPCKYHLFPLPPRAGGHWSAFPCQTKLLALGALFQQLLRPHRGQAREMGNILIAIPVYF